MIERLDALGALAAVLLIDGREVARHLPGPGAIGPIDRTWTPPAQLNPTAALRAVHGIVEVSCAVAGDRVQLTSPWTISTVSRLFNPSDVVGGTTDEDELVELLGRAGLFGGDRVGVVAGWEPHDAAMHGGSRYDTRTRGFGATFPAGSPERPIVVPRPLASARLGLDGDPMARLGLTLAEALDERSTNRDHRGEPIGRREIGALLDGALRITRREQRPSAELAWRPVPTGGALSGLSAVVVANRTSPDLRRGVYEYDAVSHELAVSTGPSPAVPAWLALADRLTGIGSTTLQALLLITLDYQRPASKYEAIVYATTLKEAGAVLQSIALLSTDFGLACCPMGGGFASTEGLGPDIRPAAVVCEIAIGRPLAEPAVNGAT